MPKQKLRAQIQVADGTGGMQPVADLRFEAGEWPIELYVPAKEAESWMAQLGAEAEERGWNSNSLSHFDAAENSGTRVLRSANGSSPAALEIVWERPRGKELRIRAKPSGNPALSLEVAQDVIKAVAKRMRTGKVLRAHRQTLLTYDGLPWRGELWLDDNLCLGPPSKHSDSLLGPQIVMVHAMVEGIGQWGVTANFQKRVHELRVFLSFVLGVNLKESKFERRWIHEVDAESRVTNCKLGETGYIELSAQAGFPDRGFAPPIERRDVTRPNLGTYGITFYMYEMWVPGDIEPLWQTFMELAPTKRNHLLRAGNAYLTAQLMWPNQRTAYATFLVVACEALKPIGKKGDGLNVYDVVASLVSKSDAQYLRQLTIHPQQARNKHLHRGELLAGELLPMLFDDYFGDPSFNEMLHILSTVSRMCLIEWLRVEGKYTIVKMISEAAGSRRAERNLKQLLSDGVTSQAEYDELLARVRTE